MQVQEKKIKGFSLLELLVVLMIVGVVSAAAYPNFNEWRKEREVRGAAIKIKNLFNGITTQVQRGLYGFAQVEVSPLPDQVKLISRGMLMSNMAQRMSGSSDDWKSKSTRCKLDAGEPEGEAAEGEEPEIYWDEDGENDNKPEVGFLEIDNIAVSVLTQSAVCFSKDGTWFSGTGGFINGSDIITSMYICSKVHENCVPDFTVTKETAKTDESKKILEKMNLFYALGWSRFGNIKLEKWSSRKGEWVIIQ